MNNEALLANKDREQFGSSFSSFIINLFMVFLLWLFSIAVFVPLSSLVQSSPSLGPVVGIIFFIAIVYFLAKALQEGKRTIDLFARMTSSKSKKRETKAKLTLIRNGGYAALTLLTGAVTVPLMWWINPVLGGILSVSIIITSMFFALPLLQKAVDKLVSMAS